MMNTTTADPSTRVVSLQLYRKLFTIYITTGIPCFILNMLICVGILSTRSLRLNKSILLLAMQSFVDAFSGLALGSAGIYRYYISYVDPTGTRSPWQCFWTLPSLLITFFFSAQAGLYLVISIDRMLAVVWPFVYLSLTIKYAYRIIVVTVSLMVVEFTAYTITSYNADQRKRVPAICFWNWSIGDTRFASMHYIVALVFSWASVGMYAFVVVWYLKYTRKKIGNVGNAEKLRRLKQQSKLNTSLGLAVLGTFIFYIIPNHMMGILTILGMEDVTASTTTTLIYTFAGMKNMNPICNFFIFVVRHGDIRRAVGRVVTMGTACRGSNAVGGIAESNKSRSRRTTGKI